DRQFQFNPFQFLAEACTLHRAATFFLRGVIMTDLLSETLLFLGQASRRFPRDERGRAPSTTTLWRWRTKGIRGVRLEAARVGGRVVTSLEAIRRFLERLSGPAQTLVTISSGRLARGLWSRPTVAIDLASIPDPANVHLFAFVS